ncbi:unnamed protein product [Durusdinium trenchii]|uniref:JmjC domain-containing protein n=1 Tax=Durusdinium trenchii TaxID=1381693 RepID=A0ABP0R432_9DINO
MTGPGKPTLCLAAEIMRSLEEQQQEWAGTLAGAAEVKLALELAKKALGLALEEEPSEGIARKDAAEVLQKLHDTCWEHLHGQRLSECLSLWREVFALNCLLRSTGSETAREALRLLDLGLILGGPETHVAETLFAQAEDLAKELARKRGLDEGGSQLLAEPAPFGKPSGLVVKRPVEEVKDLGMEDFLVIYFNKKRPVVLRQSCSFWPAIRRWCKEDFWCHGALGQRFVPVERDYWMEEGFEIMQLKDFIQHCKAEASERSTSQASAVERLSKGGYLAQHALLDQLPSLEADVQTPDFALCGSTGTVLRQVFFGPNGTVTPVHWDPYENIFCQVVGEKYLRLYPPSEAPKLYPRTSSDQEMQNNSQIEPADLLLGEREGGSAYAEKFPELQTAQYWDVVLQPGDVLYLPIGWWHFVKSLSISISLAFHFT